MVSSPLVDRPIIYSDLLVCVRAVVEIRSDTSLAEAVKLLARNKLLSALVVDVQAPEDASWIDRYIGIVEFAGIVVWILHQVRSKHDSFTCYYTLFRLLANWGI